MDIEIRDKFNKYIESHKQLRNLFDELNEEDGIALQYFFENFAKNVLEQRQETRPHETFVIGSLPNDDSIEEKALDYIEDQIYVSTGNGHDTCREWAFIAGAKWMRDLISNDL